MPLKKSAKKKPNSVRPNDLASQVALFINDLNNKLNQGGSLSALVKSACDGLKKFLRLQGTVLMQRSKPGANGDTLSLSHLNLGKVPIELGEKITGIRAAGLKIPLFSGSVFKRLYDSKKPVTVTDSAQILQYFKDMTASANSPTQKLAERLVRIFKIKMLYMVPLVLNGRSIGHIGCVCGRELDPGEKESVNMVCSSITVVLARREYEASIKEGQERYSLLFNEMTDAFALHDIVCGKNGAPVDYRFLEMNPAFEKLTGISRKKAIGRTMKEMMPESEHRLLKAFGDVALGGKSARFEHDSKAFGKVLEVTAYSPSYKKFAAIYTNITERKSSDEEQNKLKTAIEQSTATIMITDSEGRIEYVNPAFTAATGYSRKDAIGSHPSMLKSGEHPRPFYDLLWKQIKSGKTWKGEFHNKRKNNTLFWFNTNIAPIKDSAGDITHFVAVSEDITERKKAEYLLKLSEERLQLALFAANQGLYDINLKTGEFITSIEYARMLGFKPEEMKENYASWLGRMHPDDRKRVDEYYQSYLNGDINVFHIEFRQEARDGRWVWILSQGNVVEWDSEGNPVRMTGTHTNISEQKSMEEELRKLKTAIEQSTATVIITDRDGRIEYVNPAFATSTGYSRDEAIGSKPNILKSDRHPPSFYEKLWKQILSGETWSGEFYNRKKDGSFYWVNSNIAPIKDESGKITHFVSINEDITEKKNAEHLLKLSEERLKLALFAANQGLYDIDLKTGDFIISTEYVRMLGFTPEEMRETYSTWIGRMHPDDRQRVETYYYSYLKGDFNVFRIEFRQKTKDGRWVWILSQGNVVEWDREGNPVRMTGTHTNITEQKKMEEELIHARTELEKANKELEKLSQTDSLTGIPNRRYFDWVYEREWGRATRKSEIITLIMIDIDFFKYYNDYYGHLKGDLCLKLVAEAIKKSVGRPPDVAARYGGEEFIVLLPDTGVEGARSIAEKIQQALAKMRITHEKSETSKYVTVSMGISSRIPGAVDQPTELIDAADKALYIAKREGRNCIRVDSTSVDNGKPDGTAIDDSDRS